MSMLHSAVSPVKHALQIQHIAKVLEWCKHVNPETHTGSDGRSSMLATDEVTNPQPTASKVVTVWRGRTS